MSKMNSNVNLNANKNRNKPGGGGLQGAGGNKNKMNMNNSNNNNLNNSIQSLNNSLNANNSSEWMKNIPILGAPTFDLKTKEKTDESKKFTGRCRVFVANLPNDITEEKLRNLFEAYGEVAEVFLGKGNSYAFVKMDTRKNAESARGALDFKNYEGRVLRVRLAAHAAALRVKNLSPMVTNELLEYSFSLFGEVERAIVITDDRGRPVGEGIVEFARKSSAQQALKRCSSECFILTAMPMPVYVETLEQHDEEEGFPEKHVNKHIQEFRTEREVGPRFAEPGSFENEYAMRWKQLFDLEKQKRDRLDAEIKEARTMLQEQMDYARVEHQTKVLRERLRQMEEQSFKLSQQRTDRLGDERRRDEERQRQELILRQQEEDILRRQHGQDFGALRRQESDLRMQANALQDILDRQEQAILHMTTGMNPAADQQIFANRGLAATLNDSVSNQTLPPPNMNMNLNMNMNTGLAGPPGPGPITLGGPGPVLNRPGSMRAGPIGGLPPPPPPPQSQQRFNRPNFNQGPQSKRRRF